MGIVGSLENLREGNVLAELRVVGEVEGIVGGREGYEARKSCMMGWNLWCVRWPIEDWGL